jgi:hypothetical protein
MTWGTTPSFREDQTRSLTQGYSFTPVRHCSRACAGRLSALVTDVGERW